MGKRNKEGRTIYMTPENWAIVDRLVRQYPERDKNAIISGAVLFLGDHLQFGLNADCKPNKLETLKPALLEVIREELLKDKKLDGSAKKKASRQGASLGG